MIEFIYIFCLTIIGIFLITESFNIKRREKRAVRRLFIFSFVLIFILGSIAYYLDNKKHREKTGKDISVKDYLNAGNKNFFTRISVGLGTGVVFGIIDNAGLWFGMEALDPLFPRGELTKAGFGNVFSDTLSAFLATFAGNIISNLTGVDANTPLWADAFGTFIGCFIGLFGSKWITGRQ